MKVKVNNVKGKPKNKGSSSSTDMYVTIGNTGKKIKIGGNKSSPYSGRSAGSYLGFGSNRTIGQSNFDLYTSLYNLFKGK